MDDLLQSVEQNLLDPLVKFSHPMVQICVAFKVQSVDLRKSGQLEPIAAINEEVLTDRGLHLAYEVLERLEGERTGLKFFNQTGDFFVRVDQRICFVLKSRQYFGIMSADGIRRYLKNGYSTSQFTDIRNVFVFPSVTASRHDVSVGIIRVDEHVPLHCHA